MPFVTTFVCTAGHEQQRYYGSTIPRRIVEQQCVLSVGGVLPDIGLTIPVQYCETCRFKSGAKSTVKYTLEEVP